MNSKFLSRIARHLLSVRCLVLLSALVTFANVFADHQYVDLGLPSGTLWATCNVGANSPEEYGDYFAWGETEPKEDYYSWDCYKWCNGSWNTMTKYCTYSDWGTVDNKSVLDLEDDAAHVNWGGSWRMPTKEEIDELFHNCSWSKTTQLGVEGYKVVGSNGNSIFLPAGGNRSTMFSVPEGTDGNYWSSSLSWYYSYFAFNIFFSRESYGNNDNVDRRSGLSVRPVCSAPSNEVLVSSITIKGSSAQLKQGETLRLRAEVMPENATNKSVIWTSDNTSVATVSGDGLVTAMSAGRATIKATAKDGSGVSATFGLVVESAGNTGSHQYVDLGLPSGTLWATCNVGANSPEEYGDYFAWGETEPKSYYEWDNYKWYNSNEYSITKYCTDSEYGTVDNKTVLDPEDDAAHVNWGGSWRMPTKGEQEELQENCTWTWATQNGKNGYNVKGPNGNSIFLPAVGLRGESGSVLGASSDGNYWSSSLNGGDFAYNLGFNSGHYDRYFSSRFFGISVRPVYSAPSNEVLVSSITIKGSSAQLKQGETLRLRAEVMPENATNKSVIWTSDNTSVATVSYEGLVTAMSAGRATIKATAKDGSGVSATFGLVVESTGNTGSLQYVDLGLPSGLLWSDRNIGASSPQDPGYYYSWGEIEPKNVYSWENYKFCNGSAESLTKYGWNSTMGIVDHIRELESADDVATVMFGKDYHIPTAEEYQELLDNTDQQPTTIGNTAGWLFTSKQNGKSIFFPNGGHRSNFGTDDYYKDQVYCWASTNYDCWGSNAQLLNADSRAYVSSIARCVGLNVRPVSVAKPAPTSGSYLVVWHKDGSKVYFDLADRPSVNYYGDLVSIETMSSYTEYKFNSIRKMTYELTAPEEIATIEMPSKKPFRVDSGSLVFSPGETDLHVRIFNLGGKCLQDVIVAKDKPASLSLNYLELGIYLINVNGVTYKINVR